jgi:heme exporter protein A
MLQIQGANGSGKTSLLRILCGLTLPDKGEVLWNGENAHEHSYEYLRDLSYIGHTNGVKTELTALENLVVARAMAVPNEEVSNNAALERSGLVDYENTQARKLSSGQRRRLALARLMITNARIWILDEPFTALDDNGKKMVKEMLSEHAASGGITVLATHEPVDIQHIKITMVTL